MQGLMTHILLIGTDLPLLEGLAQTFASLGFSPLVAQSVNEGRELAAQHPPLVVLLSRSLNTTGAEALTIPLAGGGARLLYHSPSGPTTAFSHAAHRSVLADLTLPLERNRLVALVQRVEERARATGRSDDPSSQQASPG
jgi:DNA-binding NtrC family response regulator